MDLWELTDLATPWSVHVVVTLRVAEHLVAGPAAIGDLASAVRADPDALARVLRQLIGKGLFEEPSPGRFARVDATPEPALVWRQIEAAVLSRGWW